MVGVGGWVDVSLCQRDEGNETDEVKFDENGGRCGFSGFRAGKEGPDKVSASSCYRYSDGMSRGETSTYIQRLIPIKLPLLLSILVRLPQDQSAGPSSRTRTR
jgi:hypothetical protein